MRKPEMYYLVPKMCLSHQSKVDNSDNVKINIVLSQGTVDNCTDYPLQISFKVRNNLFRIILPTESHPGLLHSAPPTTTVQGGVKATHVTVPHRYLLRSKILDQTFYLCKYLVPKEKPRLFFYPPVEMILLANT